MKSAIVYRSLVFLIVFNFGCCAEETPLLDQKKNELYSFSVDDNLLIDVSESKSSFFLHFEKGDFEIEKKYMISIDQDRDMWRSILNYSDGSTQEIESYGNKFSINCDMLEINPSGCAPLSSLLNWTSPVQGKIELSIKGKTSNADIVYQDTKYGYNHQIPIHGLYQGDTTCVELSLLNREDKQRGTTQLKVFIDSISTIVLPKITTTVKNKISSLCLVSYAGLSEIDPTTPFILDSNGSIRWILDLRSNPLLANMDCQGGINQLKNGNLYFADSKSNTIYEINYFGEICNLWSLQNTSYKIHHEARETHTGNFLVTVSKQGSKHPNGQDSVFDFVVEVNRDTGEIIHEWDLKEYLNPWREDLLPFSIEEQGTTINWAHANAVCEDQKNNAIIVSTRYQGVAEISYSNRLLWILGPHKGYDTSMLSNCLLNPIQNGIKIEDLSVLEGRTRTAYFDWCWGNHSTVLIDNGHLLLFDNGYKRQFSDKQKYSRAVEYRINQKSKEVEQVWEYGEELTPRLYSSVVSSVQKYNNEILFALGDGVINSNGVGGRIIDVDYNSKEILYEVELSTAYELSFYRAYKINI